MKKNTLWGGIKMNMLDLILKGINSPDMKALTVSSMEEARNSLSAINIVVAPQSDGLCEVFFTHKYEGDFQIFYELLPAEFKANPKIIDRALDIIVSMRMYPEDILDAMHDNYVPHGLDQLLNSDQMTVHEMILKGFWQLKLFDIVVTSLEDARDNHHFEHIVVIPQPDGLCDVFFAHKYNGDFKCLLSWSADDFKIEPNCIKTVLGTINKFCHFPNVMLDAMHDNYED